MSDKTYYVNLRLSPAYTLQFTFIALTLLKSNLKPFFLFPRFACQNPQLYSTRNLFPSRITPRRHDASSTPSHRLEDDLDTTPH